jgi:hypothetical protein
LEISKKIIELLDGEIGFKSTFGKGSTFWFHIPITLTNEIPTNNTNKVPLKDIIILIVDDNRINCEILSKQMVIWGAKCIVNESAIEGIISIRKYSNTKEN